MVNEIYLARNNKKDEFQIMRRTLSFADKSSARFTSTLLRLEERMSKLEARCDDLSRTLNLFKKLLYQNP